MHPGGPALHPVAVANPAMCQLKRCTFLLQAFMLFEVARAIRASAASYAPEGREQALPGPILLSLNSAYDVVAFVACCGELKAKTYCISVTCTWREN